MMCSNTDPVTQSRARVQRWLAANPRGRTMLAKTADVLPENLRTARSASWNPTYKTLRQLICALDRIEGASKQESK